MAAIAPSTLPGWIHEQARRRPERPALRHKFRGAWQVRSWRETAATVERLAHGLARFGFGRGDRLVLAADAGEPTLLLALAAMRCAGAVVPLDPALGAEVRATVLSHVTPRFVVASDDETIEWLCEEGWPVIDANPRQLPAHSDSRVIDYAQLDALDASVPVPFLQRADGALDAFVFVRAADEGRPVELHLSHAALLDDAQRFVETLKLTADEEVFADSILRAEGYVRWLITPWLCAGFRLNFPESDSTCDVDRREIAPTLVAARHASYARIAQAVADRLPAARSWRRRLLARATDGGHRRAPERWLTRWLLTRPLAEVVGFARVRTALALSLADAPVDRLDPATDALFRALGIAVQAAPQAGSGPSSEKAGADTVGGTRIGASAGESGTRMNDWAPLFEREGAATR